ncbi:TadE/TadG family type IV pilus assembly protein [Aureimonas pseudogalii]|uniref:Flp pilus assembly protein TadG n=1 Tax=Aureimonas pseudogalii TaxID=1744844 RepID=A0A7W6ECS1_9HYPH|nr:TadE/TadG family type IV pilus assembly protein [Aureimonas pseudogalii]MBB3997646.1 Flp pilus assembly protein TadG [Aureimonas pseudogalii]
MKRHGRRSARRRFTDASGIASIEFALLAPLLIVLLLASVTLFDLYRSAKTAEAASFNVSDILSRQLEVNNGFLAMTYKIFLRSTGRSEASVRYRVTSIKTVEGAAVIDWSYAVSPSVKMTAADLKTLKLPLLSKNDSVVLVETWSKQSPLSEILGRVFSDLYLPVFARPRYTSSITMKTGS